MRPVVVVCHESYRSKDWGFVPELSERLARAGFAAVSHTARAGSELAALERVLEGVRDGAVGTAALQYALIGHGAGGAAAVRRSAADSGVRALVTWGVPAGELLATAAAVRAPWLIIHGGGDAVVPPEAGRVLHGARPGSELLLVAGAGHDFGAHHPWTGSNPELERAVGATVQWLARHLP